ncbi:MAG: HAD family hydrolase [Patescibacteria group bacterium]|jgi:FMN phosphatase YigB (HAD superfamily)
MIPGKIQHIWFDFSGTLAFTKNERLDRLRYETYSSVVKKPIDDALILEYETLYKKHSDSNAALFCSLGFPISYWSDRINSLQASELYTLADNTIPEILRTIQTFVPVSLLSNISLKKALPAIGIDQDVFTHIISADTLTEPKPSLQGFYKMIELSNLPAKEILYIGDHVSKDILPAKQLGISTGILWSTSHDADYSFETFADILDFVKNNHGTAEV